MSSNHNGNNNVEVARIRKEHPGEHGQCVSNDRVLGAIAVTRGIWPPELSYILILNSCLSHRGPYLQTTLDLH